LYISVHQSQVISITALSTEPKPRKFLAAESSFKQPGKQVAHCVKQMQQYYILILFSQCQKWYCWFMLWLLCRVT